ncbi:MAG: EamA family transporter, partial [Aestuariivirgaceae bacterium]
MTTTVFVMVVSAAVLHAVWNTLVKGNGDRLMMMATMMASQAVIAVLVLPFVAFPTPASWPFIAASVGLHSAYYLFLIMAYRHGDLSHVYPLARGSSPLIVAVISVVIVGEVLSRGAMASIVLIALGIMSLT